MKWHNHIFDPDDLQEPKAFKRLLECMESYHSDVVVSKRRKMYSSFLVYFHDIESRDKFRNRFQDKAKYHGHKVSCTEVSGVPDFFLRVTYIERIKDHIPRQKKNILKTG